MMFYAVGSILLIVESFFWAAIRKWLNNLVLRFWCWTGKNLLGQKDGLGPL